jgi:hypothetical protein
MACSIIRNKKSNEIEQVLAPNGRESILFKSINGFVTDKEQALRYWAQVYTPEFKLWFGDWENKNFYTRNASKVVDANGEPLVVYHGTGNMIEEFRESTLNAGLGIYTTSNKAYADQYRRIDMNAPISDEAGTTMPLFIRMINPQYLTEAEYNEVANVQSIPSSTLQNMSSLGKLEGDRQNTEQDKLGDVILSNITDVKPRKAFPQVQEHDGIIMEHENSEYVVFKPTQVKSVFNQGTFNSEQPNIYYQLSSKAQEKASQELDDHLLKFLKPFGVRSKEFEELKSRLGIDSLGATDVLNKLIWYTRDRKIDTLPEEAAHMIVMLMGENHPAIKELMTEVSAWSEFVDIYNEYFPKYNNEKQVKIEAIGKLLAKSLVNKYKENGLDKNLLSKALKAVEEFFKRILKSMSLYEALNYPMFLADKIALNVLAGNQNFIAKLTPNLETLNYDQAINNNPHAKDIIDTFTKNKFNFQLVGSLAIAGQGEVIQRPSNDPIHDLDFIVRNPNETDNIINHMSQIGAIPIHNGWQNGKYITRAYLIPKEGYEVTNIFRGASGWIGSFELMDKNKNIVPASSQNTISVDFFIYKEKPTNNDETIINIFSSWQDIYSGKLGLSPLNENERFFQREKDQKDYVNSKPKNLSKSKPEFVYLQDKPQSERLSDPEIDKRIQTFLEKIGVSVLFVRNIKDSNGNPISAVAKADMLNKIIEVVKGRADITTLPEEAAHFFVEMLGDGHPLLKEMMSKITSFKLYSKVVNDYKGKAAYRNADGTVNFAKIKKEAIGKIIAAHILKADNIDETTEKLTELANWWYKVLDFIKNIFKSVDTNPFAFAADKILKADTSGLDLDANLVSDEFYQLDNSTEQAFKILMDDQSKITLDNSIDPVTKQKRHVYTYGGEPTNGSVTSIYVDAWLRKVFRSDNRSEAQQMLDLLKAEYGDVIHEQMQEIIKSWTNADGSLSNHQTAHATLVSKTIYDKLNGYAKDILGLYPEGTIFKSEVKVYDKKKKIAGSIDLLVVMPDGTVDIYDWKSQEISKHQTDIKTYKEPMYRIQLENYRKILELEYGFKKFGRIRAIPIKTEFVYNKGNITQLKDIEIGSIDPSQIPDTKAYLLPVTLRNEKTGIEDLDLLIVKLNGIYDKLENQRYPKDQAYKKHEELGRLRVVLRDLQLRNKVNKLIDLGMLEFKKYSEKVANNTLTGKEVMESVKILQVFSESGIFLYDMMADLQSAAKESTDPNAIIAYNELRNRFSSMTARTNKLIKDIEQYRNELAVKLGEEKGIENLLLTEKPVGVLNGTFSALSSIYKKSYRVFAKLLRRVQHRRDVKFNQMTDKLGELEANFITWAKKNNLTVEKGIEKMLSINEQGKWNGNFLSKYQAEFYAQRELAIKKGDFKWIMSNMDFDPKEYTIKEKEQRDFFNEFIFNADEKINQEMINKKMAEWINSHKVILNDGTVNQQALMNAKNRFLKPNDEWFSTKWIELNRSENKPLLDVYNYFQSMIRDAEKLGMLDKYSPGFIPSIYATKVDQLVFGDISNLMSGSGFFENLEVDADVKYSPEIDPTTGMIINRIPVYFTKDMGVTVKDKDGNTSIDYSKKSRDLFKVFGVWGAHMYNYEAMAEIEDASLILLEAEKNKSSLVTDTFGNIVRENGEIKAADKNDKNAKLLEDFIHYYLYDRIGDLDKDFVITNPFTGKKYSGMKSISAAMQFFSFKTLALNPISGTAQFVGGTGNALFMSRKGIFFNTKTWAKAMYMVSKRGFGSEGKKVQAALQYFNIRLEGNQSKALDNLSLSTTNKIITHDNGYIIQRMSDAGVQYPVAVAMMLNHMIDENNNIVDINDYVKAKYNYNTTFYNMSEADRKTTRDKIDAEVKELQDTKSLLVLGSVDSSGKFVLPGIEEISDTVGDFRHKIKGVTKKLIGNSTRDDINKIRTTLGGMALMQFRSWIPAMVEERFDTLKYNDELGVYTYGKSRLFFAELFSKRLPILLKGIVAGFGNDAIEAGKAKYQELKRDAIEAGEEFNITEGEFIDLYLGNLRSMVAELLTITAFASSLVAMGTLTKDDDDDKGIKRYINRGLKKYYAEFSFYYIPTSFTELVKVPLPVIGLAEDFMRFTSHITQEVIGQAFNEEWAEKAKPSKYFFRMVPIAKEAMLMQAAYDDEFRKEWGIVIQ